MVSAGALVLAQENGGIEVQIASKASEGPLLGSSHVQNEKACRVCTPLLPHVELEHKPAACKADGMWGLGQPACCSAPQNLPSLVQSLTIPQDSDFWVSGLGMFRV